MTSLNSLRDEFKCRVRRDHRIVGFLQAILKDFISEVQYDEYSRMIFNFTGKLGSNNRFLIDIHIFSSCSQICGQEQMMIGKVKMSAVGFLEGRLNFNGRI